MRKIDNLDFYRIIVSMGRTGSAKLTGDKLGLETSNVFRCLRQVEKELGAPLFDREKRPMQLTEKGRTFCSIAEQMLTLQNHLLDVFNEDVDEDEGLIRIASTAGARHNLITPAIVQYQAEHPKVQFELQDMTDGHDLFMKTLSGLDNDIVFRYLPDSPLPEGVVMREIFPIPFYACASPWYLKTHEAPSSPIDCNQHTGILLQLLGRKSVEHLVKDGRSERLMWGSTTRFNSQLDARDALVLGAGVIPDLALPYFYEVAKAGQAVPVMQGWHRPTAMSCLFIASEAMKKKRVQLFVDWLCARYNAI